MKPQDKICCENCFFVNDENSTCMLDPPKVFRVDKKFVSKHPTVTKYLRCRAFTATENVQLVQSNPDPRIVVPPNQRPTPLR